MKQEPRPAYHRRRDLERLKELAAPLPLIVTDEQGQYIARHFTMSANVLVRGRFEVVTAYLRGWLDSRA